MTTTNWDRLEDALRGLRHSSPEGFTTVEFADRMKCSVPVGRKRIGELIREGTLNFVGNRSVTRMDGRAGVVPVYAQSGTEKK